MKNARTMRQLIAATAAVFLGFVAVGATYYVNPESGDNGKVLQAHNRFQQW